MGNCILVSVSPANEAVWTSYLQENLAAKWQKIGLVGNTKSCLRVFTTDNLPLIEVNIAELGDRYYNAIERRIASV